MVQLAQPGNGSSFDRLRTFRYGSRECIGAQPGLRTTKLSDLVLVHIDHDRTWLH